MCTVKLEALSEGVYSKLEALPEGVYSKLEALSEGVYSKLEALSEGVYSKLREREMFYLTTQSTHFIYGYWRQTYG